MACISNQGYIDAAEKQATAIRNKAVADTLIFGALALWQRNSSLSISNMQKEIADRQMKLAEYLDEHARKFWPYERAYVDDAFGITKAEPQRSGLSAAWGAILDDTLRRGRSDWLAEARTRCLAPSRCEAARWDRNAQKARADIISFADRQAESRAEVLNDLRYARQLSALALGKGILSNVASYQDVAGTVGVNARGALIGTINSGLQALGYALNRNRPLGWGQGVSNPIDRMPYEPVRVESGPIRKPTPAQAFPVITPGRVEESDPCGPMPSADASDEAWRAWYDCKGYK